MYSELLTTRDQTIYEDHRFFSVIYEELKENLILICYRSATENDKNWSAKLMVLPYHRYS